MWTGILFSCLLLHVWAESSPDPRHLVVIPAKIYSGATEKVCVYLTHLHEPLKITVTLEHGGKNVTLLEQEITDRHWFQCVEFKVPNIIGSAVGSLHVSGHGGTYKFEKSKKVWISESSTFTIVETDKTYYKPGDTVKFRILSLNDKFTVAHQKYPAVYIEDSKSNAIMRWLDVETQQGIADLQFNLSSEAPLGSYLITMKKENESSAFRYFMVEERVLPKFHTQLKIPTQITILDEQINVELCGKYIYGKPVRGEVQLKICLPSTFYFYTEEGLEEGICQTFSKKLDKKGCISQVVSTEVFNMRSDNYRRDLVFMANLTEEGTGIIVKEDGIITISNMVAGLTFEEEQKFYQQGIPYSGKISAKKFDGTPLPSETISLVITINEEATTKNYTTDNLGNVYFTLDTTSWGNNSVELEAKFATRDSESWYYPSTPWYRNVGFYIEHFYSKSGSFLIMQPIRTELSCDTKQAVQVDYHISRKEFGKSTNSLDFYYLVLSKGKIILDGHKELALGNLEVLKGTFSVSLPVSLDVAPVAKMLIYTILPDGEVLADAATFEISKCLKNKANLKFSVLEDFPGADVNLHLQASPGSLCSVRAVDKSAILKSDRELTIDYFFDIGDDSGYPYEVSEYFDSCSSRKRKRSLQWKTWSNDITDVFTLFRHLSLKIITDAKISAPCPEASETAEDMISGGETPILARKAGEVDSKPEKKKEMIRKYFPETWIWDLIPVGPSGEKQVPVHVPDTITEWKAEMFCIANVGFGLSPPAYLNSFKTFFVDFTLPYSVIRGETFTLKATAFNYLTYCIMVRVTLQEAEDFVAKPCENCIYTSCLCADESKTFSWNITTKSLGDVNFTVSAEALQTDILCENEVVAVPEKGAIDTVIKSLPVKVEGVRKEKIHNSIICTKDSAVTEKISLTLPDTVVEGSVESSVTVLGNILGLSLHYPDLLLDIPMGCGEQTMALFTTNAYVLQYLEKTGLVNSYSKAEAVKNMELGYQAILQLKTKNGSYELFRYYYGDDDEEHKGNVWLTAYVVSSFNKAKPYIFIPEKVQKEAINWISSKQMDDGCFRSDMIYDSLWSASDQTVAVSAYITAALLELKDPSLEPVVKRGLDCLKKHFTNETSIYDMAVMVYTFTLAGDDDMRETLLQKLDTLAVKEDEMEHWKELEKPEPEEEDYYYKPLPSELEMTSYVLLARMSKPTVTSPDITSAYRIVKWIIKHQNSHGGFMSSQDTVVSLKALTKYAEYIYNKDSVNKVTVKSDKGFTKDFHLDNTNSLLLQKEPLPLPIAYTTEVTGNGCVVVQVTLKYNVPWLKRESGFSISVEAIPNECSALNGTSFDLKIKVGYTGKRLVSNMVIIDVSMLSGFIPEKKSVKLLNKAPLVGRTEIETTNVIIYLEHLKNETQEYTFTVEKDFEVKNLKPASVKIYDYYKPDEHATTEYSAPDCHH
ncbi:alpha-2-macroglobulin-like [Latimeria chalumnae]|uniref:alpha-2-macroglobulin-like n=1 Tax=Latimeria chalumnae TaxID=7897 RepID=UPI00313EA3B6